jgi:large subunit ribosomal protein L15
MPLIRRLPKRGFNNAAFKTVYATVNVSALNVFEDGATVNEATLLEKKLIRGNYDGVKVLATGELTKKLVVAVDKVSAAAVEKIQKAGGSVQAVAAE